MNICFFAIEHHSLGSGGGIASYLDALVPELTKLGHEVHILVKGKRDNTQELDDRIFLHEFKGGNLHWYLSKLTLIGKHLALPIRELEWSFGFYHHLKALKKKYQIDLIESSETGSFFTSLFEKKIPLVIRLHGSTYSFETSTKGVASLGARLDRILQRYSFKRAQGLSAPSNFQRKLFENEGAKIINVKVIPNPVSIEDFTEPKTPNNKGTKTIFYAGRIADVKGIWPLLRAFTQVVKQIPEVRLIMAGAPHVSIPTEAIKRFINEYNIADNVELPGYIQKDRIREFYKACSVYVVPSYYETFCISAIEAMLNRKPIVASSGTALEEIVEDGITGLLVPPGNDEALADALLKLLNDDELARHMGGVGCEKALNYYQASSVARRTLQFYVSVLGKHTSI